MRVSGGTVCGWKRCVRDDGGGTDVCGRTRGRLGRAWRFAEGEGGEGEDGGGGGGRADDQQLGD